jgi:hypothetical protein
MADPADGYGEDPRPLGNKLFGDSEAVLFIRGGLAIRAQNNLVKPILK